MPDLIVEVPKKRLDSIKEHLSRIPKHWIPPILILLAIPLTLSLSYVKTNYFSHAGGYDFATIHVNPGSINARVGDKIPMSALGYDSQNNPIYGVQDYSWSMSSTNTVGTLTQDAGKINEFDALKVGCGEITVTGNWNGIAVTQGVSVAVSDSTTVPSCESSPTPTDAPTLTPGDTATPTETPTLTPTVTPSPTPSQGTYHVVKIYPTADSYVRKDKPNTNFGKSGELIADAGPVSISYLRFNISDLTGKKIVLADLVLYVPNITGAQSNATFRLKNTGSNWTEKSLMYTNKPAVGSVIASQPKIERQTSYGFSLLSYISDQSNKTINLALDTLSSDGGIFRSREGGTSTRPYIEIDYYQ